MSATYCSAYGTFVCPLVFTGPTARGYGPVLQESKGENIGPFGIALLPWDPPINGSSRTRRVDEGALAYSYFGGVDDPKEKKNAVSDSIGKTYRTTSDSLGHRSSLTR
ncbi:hypothetical protein EV363DRAFT_1398975 [Boletus edulis]|nr:hypothetical protein EV363DRAFT_1398975 [Boletus edulis]